MASDSDHEDREADRLERLEDHLGIALDEDQARVLDTTLTDDYLALLGRPWRDGPLPERTRELVGVAVTAATTHLDHPGLRRHVGRAFDAGATVDELVAVLYLTAQLGNHSVTDGMPILADEVDEPELSDRQRDLLDAFEREREYWGGMAPAMEHLARFDPEFFAAMTTLTHDLYRDSTLDRKTLELISIAVDASTTHLYGVGTRTHVRNALDAGATPAEITQVFELAAVLGVHTLRDGLPVVAEEADRRGLLDGE